MESGSREGYPYAGGFVPFLCPGQTVRPKGLQAPSDFEVEPRAPLCALMDFDLVCVYESMSYGVVLLLEYYMRVG